MRKTCILSAALLCATAALAQTPAPNQAPLQIPDPHYTTIDMSVNVKAPADKVWARVGKFCDFGESAAAPEGNPCKYISGDGGFGTVRSLVNEVLVGQTPTSYTYAQAPRQNTPFNLYHGTLEVIPVGATTSRLHLVLFYDTSMLGDAAAVSKAVGDRRTSFTKRLENLKTLAEGGKLTPADAPLALPTAAAVPFQNPNPHYIVIPLQMDIKAPADVVWSRIGHFCDIGELGAIGYPTCMIVSGTDGEYGVVRNVGREVLVGKTAHSYTYAQQMRTGGYYILYHGTIEARPVTPATSTLHWTLVYDNANLPDDAAREKEIATRRTRFLGMMQVVKTLAEGGNVPPDAPAR